MFYSIEDFTDSGKDILKNKFPGQKQPSPKKIETLHATSLFMSDVMS